VEASGTARGGPRESGLTTSGKKPTARHTSAPESQLRCPEEERRTHAPGQNGVGGGSLGVHVRFRPGWTSAPQRRHSCNTCVNSRECVHVFHFIGCESAASLCAVYRVGTAKALACGAPCGAARLPVVARAALVLGIGRESLWPREAAAGGVRGPGQGGTSSARQRCTTHLSDVLPTASPCHLGAGGAGDGATHRMIRQRSAH
jgi:hypothetical protein